MQLATTSNDKPWVCSVYYVADKQHNIYWLSWPSRRHSQNILAQPNVAATIAVKYDKPVIGVHVEGEAEKVVYVDKVQEVMNSYTERHNAGHNFYENFKNGSNKHVMYRIKPSKFVLFDEMHFINNPRQEIVL